MKATSGSGSDAVRKTKATVGAIAITLLLLFTFLALLGAISPLEWIIADIIVAVVANLILRSLGKPRKQQTK